LPTIIGHNKQSAGGIFLLNLLLGWTVIGWVAAMAWACSAEARLPVLVVAGPGRFCMHCGTASPGGARYCLACGRPV
jgi:hypothetical protein